MTFLDKKLARSTINNCCFAISHYFDQALAFSLHCIIPSYLQFWPWRPFGSSSTQLCIERERSPPGSRGLVSSSRTLRSKNLGSMDPSYSVMIFLAIASVRRLKIFNFLFYNRFQFGIDSIYKIRQMWYLAATLHFSYCPAMYFLCDYPYLWRQCSEFSVI
jgi:hypothetical protein